MSDEKYVKKKISYCLKCKKQTRDKDKFHKQISEYKTCNAKRSVFVKEY